jgi:hypothetical protein
LLILAPVINCNGMPGEVNGLIDIIYQVAEKYRRDQ